MATIELKNWFGDLVSHPAVLVDAHSVDDLVVVLKDPATYPSPVRAVGSNHSTARCNAMESGTIVRMIGMNRILSVTADRVTAEAGAIYLDVAQELDRHGLQFYVNTEIGNLTLGSAACAGTKDASMPGEFGQVGSYVVGIKLVLPSGDLWEVTDQQPDLLQLVRSSYGLFGIVYDVTFQVRSVQPLAVYHETFTLADFTTRLPELKARNESMMMFMFPFENLLTVEFRRYNPTATGEPNRVIWPLRNVMWRDVGPAFCAGIEATNPVPAIRYGILDGFSAIWRFKLTTLIRSDYTVAWDQIIRYPEVSNVSRYTFSLWAFPEDRYPAVLTEYFQFCQTYYQQKGYRSNMLNVGYRIAQDAGSLLSYAADGGVMTIDPVSTGNPGWPEFLLAYNDFCSTRGGIPLFNQTPGLTRDQVRLAFGDKLTTLNAKRKELDPTDRMLNDYYRELLSEG
jgi:hypothetical protein